MDLEALFRLFTGLPRGGPGTDRATREALDRLPALPANPRVLDIGCGPGKQTLVLAHELHTPIIAMDIHRPFLEQLDAAARAEGVDHLITTRQGDMASIEEPAGSVDLIWSEGAIFIVGFAKGLSLWRPMLRDGGLVVVSEAAWLIDPPAEEAKVFWHACYPAITDIPGNIAIAEAAGYEVIDHFVLPQAEWWPDFYAPLEERCRALRPTADPALLEQIEENEHEIDLFRRHSDSYSYVFFILRKV
ncbi:MAG TPA: class I SAM-dependent methyltransferase [Candidatus Hydrogenedentes bacterium]|mgnify:CR=1 FL=1|nr:class I SAM-dependent methyltransferase [Candidatus Hydrogenedentota bacterium]HPG65560.1 class I SAM-dependent methyltransferase [Candidatus Hydrogenedentota bacterium]